MSLEEALKLLVTFASGGVVTAVVGPPIKNYFGRLDLATKQKEIRWAPLRTAARKLEQRLEDLTSIYLTQPPKEPWDGHEWDDSSGHKYRLPSKARDFCELYMLDQNPVPIRHWYDPGRESPGSVRKNEDKVNMLWIRFHELTYAASSLHSMAEYLARAERVREELEDGRLVITKEVRKRMSNLLLKVREELHGTSQDHPGAGIIFEHQELIGKNMRKDHDSVIDLWEFYGKLLSQEWAQFTDLFRFFTDFHLKVRTEVAKTKQALGELWRGVEKVFPELSAK